MNTYTGMLGRSFGALLFSLVAALLFSFSASATHALVYYGTGGEGEADISTGVDVAIEAEVSASSSASLSEDTPNGANLRVVPSSVRTDADLQTYVNGEIEADSDLRAVEVSDSVSVDYVQRAKLFGFIPVTVTVTTEVDADGKVSVRDRKSTRLNSSHSQLS